MQMSEAETRALQRRMAAIGRDTKVLESILTETYMDGFRDAKTADEPYLGADATEACDKWESNKINVSAFDRGNFRDGFYAGRRSRDAEVRAAIVAIKAMRDALMNGQWAGFTTLQEAMLQSTDALDAGATDGR